MSTVYSEEFYHFVGRKTPNDHDKNLSTLRLILGSGYVHGGGPHHRITSSLRETLTTGMVVPDIACFCDIPFSGLGVHVAKYGKFGLSFDRHWLVYQGARPVMYFPYRSDDAGSVFGQGLLQDIEVTYRALHNFFPPSEHERRSMGVPAKDPESAARAMRTVALKDFLAFIKPYDSEKATDAGEYFYAEREWRAMGHVRFKPGDVQTVVVARGYRARLAAEWPQYADRIREI